MGKDDLEEIRELRKVVLACMGSEEQANAAGVLVYEEEFRRKMLNNEYDSMPYFLMLKLNENQYYIIRKNEKGGWQTQDGSVVF
jgi:hypothetical protein